MPQTHRMCKSHKKGLTRVFKKKKSIKLSYIKQGLIYFTCMDYKNQPFKMQNKINNLCLEVAGEHHRALFALLTDERENITSVAMKHYISEAQLCRYRKKFYEKFFEKIKDDSN